MIDCILWGHTRDHHK